MSRIVLLEADRHRALRVHPLPRGGADMLVTLGRSEVPLAVADYPLFLAKDRDTGTFEIAALAGLVEPRNLFRHGAGWHATYLPERIVAGGFRLSPASPTGLAIDRDDPRFGATGEALFDAAGAATPFLSGIRDRLAASVEDIAAARRSAARLVSMGVVRPVVIDLSFAEGPGHALEGLYGFDGDALATLGDADVTALFRSGDLAITMLMSASEAQLERLRQLHNASSPREMRDVAANLC